ncbi:MAG: 23S rRNA (adenine(2503)-C(2))-methyltransferase RlmN [Bacteroidia bacterium]|nr:23S rRNA (adenine(2503)-C(2))-methyltransferase RlmN [Bacteroidia bacterium]MCX7652961.1 23S rRNA (adenine(2503)-C(2))-methyltransferase RlmN [Bacteroidia bacterium]MDW8417476.1 23S rRNA (adenine(2503)-C(2))-methyltransferase RlmN [Bacteroidia bacterium]
MVSVGAPIWTLSLADLEEWTKSKGEPLYRAQQIWRWLWEKGVSSINQMSDLPARLRVSLASEFALTFPQLVHESVSKDKTRKFLWEMPEGGRVETVWIPHSNRYTVCISSQVGCSLNCRFCATGQLGLERQLKGYEILLQVYAVKHLLGLPVTHVVFMGMGEPLLNYTAVIEALTGLSQKLKLSPKRITISTVGIPKGILRLAERKEPFELAFSLHSAIPEKRQMLIPLAAHIPLEEIRHALGTYCEKRQEWVTLEYVLLEGVNDTPKDAEALRAFVAPPVRAKVNLIQYNPVPGLPFQGSKRLSEFQKSLMQRGLLATIRRSRGADIAAGCGQLARQV